MVSLLGGGSCLDNFLQHACYNYQVSPVYHTLSHSKLGLQQAVTGQVVVVDGWTDSLTSDCNSKGRSQDVEPHSGLPSRSNR